MPTIPRRGHDPETFNHSPGKRWVVMALGEALVVNQHGLMESRKPGRVLHDSEEAAIMQAKHLANKQAQPFAVAELTKIIRPND